MPGTRRPPARHSRTGQGQRRPVRRQGDARRNVRARTAQPAPRANYTLVIAGIGVVALIALMALFLFARGCSDRGTDDAEGGGPTVEAPAAPAFVSPYNWENLEWVNGRFEYAVDGQTVSRTGIDVSESQEYIDWYAVADDGIDFAMIRLGYRGSTEGDVYLDNYFEYNLPEAQAAGLDCGIYFFSQAINKDEAIEEAEFVLEHLDGAELEYPIAYDSEVLTSQNVSRTADLSDEQMTAVARAFCDRIEQAGYQTMVYGNYGDLSRYDRSLVESKPVWWAEYNMPSPSARIVIDFWQYSNGGTVNGIDAAVDMDIDLRAAR